VALKGDGRQHGRWVLCCGVSGGVDSDRKQVERWEVFRCKGDGLIQGGNGS